MKIKKITSSFMLAACCLASVAVMADTCTPPPPGIVAWWPGENNSADFLGMNNGTFMNGSNYATGKVGNAFNFMRTNFVLVANSASLNPTNAITVECWVYRRSTAGIADPIIKKADASSGYALEFNFARLVFTSFIDGAQYSAGSDELVPIANRSWYHVAGVYDGANLMCYVNGQLVDSVGATGLINNSSTSLRIGSDPGNPTNRFFNGLVDEPAIYNRALSANEIAAIYAAGSAGKCLAVAEPPSITSQPGNVFITLGETATFNVTAIGTTPLYYQWYFNGNGLYGATNIPLVLNNVQTNQAGNYYVRVSNAAGIAVSSNAWLEVLIPPPPTNTATNITYTCTPAPTNIVAWWRAETNALDSVGTNHGTLMGNTGYVPGEVGLGFEFQNHADYIDVAPSASLDVGVNNGFTLECWVKPADINLINQPLFDWTKVYGQDGVHLFISVYSPGTIYANIFGTDGQSHIAVSAAGVVQEGVFQHLAVSYDKLTGICKLYRNGSLVCSNSLGSFTPQTTYGLTLGTRIPNDEHFVGIMDEAAVYGRALSDAEIAAIYNAGSHGKCR